MSSGSIEENEDQPDSGYPYMDSEDEGETEIIIPTTEHSLVDVIRGELKELQEQKVVYIPVAGYEKSGLHARYRLPENGKILDDIVRRVMREYKDKYSRNLYATADTIIHLCEGLYVRHPEAGEEYVELDPDEQGYPVRFDYRLAGIISDNGTLDTERKVLFALFGYKDVFILNHGAKLNMWMMDTNIDVETELWTQLGE
jgi:hypothetical protein